MLRSYFRMMLYLGTAERLFKLFFKKLNKSSRSGDILSGLVELHYTHGVKNMGKHYNTAPQPDKS